MIPAPDMLVFHPAFYLTLIVCTLLSMGVTRLFQRKRVMSEPCRCGHQGEGPHPCHGFQYTCQAPAQQRFYNAKPAHLAGVMVKFTANDTWACDMCWARFKAYSKTGVESK